MDITMEQANQMIQQAVASAVASATPPGAPATGAAGATPNPGVTPPGATAAPGVAAAAAAKTEGKIIFWRSNPHPQPIAIGNAVVGGIAYVGKQTVKGAALAAGAAVGWAAGTALVKSVTGV